MKRVISVMLVVSLIFGQMIAITKIDHNQVASAASAFAYEQNIKPLEDSIVNRPKNAEDADKNYHPAAGTPELNADGMNVSGTGSYSYFKFDLTELPEADKIGTTLFSVWGRDTSKSTNDTAENYIEVFGASGSEDWTEMNLTWNNRPTMNAEPITEVLFSTSNAYQDADVTEYIKEQKENGAANVTFIIVAKTDKGNFYHRGKDTKAGGQNPPRLIVSDPTFIPEDMSLDSDGRSRLYPTDWYPGYTDEKGRFLHDFSYAGYHRGELSLPQVDMVNSIDVTQKPYLADPTGQTDATTAIQQAIDTAEEAGGGVVYLPTGTYQVNPQMNKSYSLAITSSNIVLKGDGVDKTFIYNASENMKQKEIIRVGTGGWKRSNVTTKLAASALEPTSLLTVENTQGFETGDYLVITFDTTEQFLEELGMQVRWKSRLGNIEEIYYRQVLAVDHEKSTITIDVPTRYPLKLRDNISIIKAEAPPSEIGLQDFSIANKQNSKTGLAENDFKESGTAGYETDLAKIIYILAVTNSWVTNVSTYKPAGNAEYHILSNGIVLERTKNVTIDHVTMQYPQYRGANGNGYLYQLKGNDDLISNSKATGARHNFTYANFAANGNVLQNVKAEKSSLMTDFHMYLSMANLIDSMVLDGDGISAISRDYGSNINNRHGVVTTESVFWNTEGIAPHSSKIGDNIIIESEQFGNGYIIGTKGNVSNVNVDIIGSIPDTDTRPFDMAEGIGEGDRLLPQSLYADQLTSKQMNRDTALQSLYVNGEAIPGMQFLKTKYNYTLPYGTTQIPVLEAAALDQDAAISIEQPTSLDGDGIITISKGGAVKSYTVHFTLAKFPTLPTKLTLAPDKSVVGWRLNTDEIVVGNTGKLVSYLTLDNHNVIHPSSVEASIVYQVSNPEIGTVSNDTFYGKKPGTTVVKASATYNGITVSSELTIQVVEALADPVGTFAAIANVKASKDDGNVPLNVVDRDIGSRWSAEGMGEHLLLELEHEQWINKSSIIFFNGHQRENYFDLEVSKDGINFTPVLKGAESTKGEVNQIETFEFTPVKAKYVRYIGQGNAMNLWNSIVEFWIHQSDDPTSPSVPSTPWFPEETNPNEPVNNPNQLHVDLGSPVIKKNVQGIEISYYQLDYAAIKQALVVLTALQKQELSYILLNTKQQLSGMEILLTQEVLQLMKEAAPQALLLVQSKEATFELSVSALYSDKLFDTITLQFNQVQGVLYEALQDAAEKAAIKVLYPGVEVRLIGGADDRTSKQVYAPIKLSLEGILPIGSISVVRFDVATGQMQYVPAIMEHKDNKTNIVIHRTGDGVYTLVQANVQFADTQLHWSKDSVALLASKLLVKGKSQTQFNPDDHITRAEFTALVSRALGLTPYVSNTFVDVSSDAWYADAIGAATGAGLINGFKTGEFAPEDTITREQMAVIIINAIQFANKGKLSKATNYSLDQFKDGYKVSAYAQEAMEMAIQYGLLNGRGQEQLTPQDQATRAEAVVILERMLRHLNFLPA